MLVTQRHLVEDQLRHVSACYGSYGDQLQHICVEDGSLFFPLKITYETNSGMCRAEIVCLPLEIDPDRWTLIEVGEKYSPNGTPEILDCKPTSTIITPVCLLYIYIYVFLLLSTLPSTSRPVLLGPFNNRTGRSIREWSLQEGPRSVSSRRGYNKAPELPGARNHRNVPAPWIQCISNPFHMVTLPAWLHQ